MKKRRIDICKRMLLFTNLAVTVLSTPTFYEFLKTADGGCTFNIVLKTESRHLPTAYFIGPVVFATCSNIGFTMRQILLNTIDSNQNVDRRFN